MEDKKENHIWETGANVEATEIPVLVTKPETKKIASVSEDDEDFNTFQYFLNLVGTNGPWNYAVIFLCTLATFSVPFQTMSYQFLGFTPSHWCHIPELTEANWTQEEILGFAIPTDSATGNYESCLMHNYNYTAAAGLGFDDSVELSEELKLGESSLECSTRDFNLTEVESSTVIEWDLVCDRRYLYSTTFSANYIVKIFVCPILGYLLDTFGRRRCIIISISIFLPCCLLAAAVSNYELYIFLRVLAAQFETCFYIGTFVLGLEISGKEQRSIIGVLYCIPWALAIMIMPGIAYLVQTWRLLQLSLTAPAAYLILYYWYAFRSVWP